MKVANRLAEAMIGAGFSARQDRILWTLMRLTYGWNRRSVRMSAPQLLEISGLGPGPDARRSGGAARDDLDLLLKEGVIFAFGRSRGVKRPLWGMQKDYTQWGKYSMPTGRLSAYFSDRPEHDDTAFKVAKAEHMEEQRRKRAAQARQYAEEMADEEDEYEIDEVPQHQGTTSIEEFDDDAEDQCPNTRALPVPQYQGTPEKAEKSECPDTGPLSAPTPGHYIERKSLFDETLQRPKDMKDSSTSISQDKVHTATASISVGPLIEKAAAVADEKPDEKRAEEIRQFALAITSAANMGIEDKWGEQIHPINYGASSALASELITAGVPIDLARRTIVSVCKASKLSAPMKAIGYFREPIFDAFRDAEQKAFDAGARQIAGSIGLASSENRGGAPRAISSVVQQELERAERAAESEYDHERRAAAIAWGEANELELRGIVREVEARYDGYDRSSSFIGRAISAEVQKLSADRCGFPSFENWQSEKAARAAAAV
jgi:phage replication O-like protein O